jgi:hypothetical protein
MNIKYITHLVLGLFLGFLFSSCNDDDTTTSYSSQTKDAQIYSFSVSPGYPKRTNDADKKQDTIRLQEIKKIRFAIDQVAGIIYNPDSMPYGTVLEKALITATYNPIYKAASVLVTTPDSIKGYVWNNTDSINVSKNPIQFVVTPVGGGPGKTYRIDLRIHKVDPDTIVWKMANSVPTPIGTSKTILAKNMFYTYSFDSGSSTLHTSKKQELLNWQAELLTGLPSNTRPESIFYFNSVFYAVDTTGKSYQSADGENWMLINNGKNITSIVGIVPQDSRQDDILLVTLNVNGKYYFGKTKDLSIIEIVEYLSSTPSSNEVPSNFALQGGASYTHFSTDKNTQMLVVTAGVDGMGRSSSLTWLIKNSSLGLELSPSVKNILFEGAGLSNFWYNNQLYTFAGNTFYTSITWGQSWTKAPNKQQLGSSAIKRSGQTVIVDNEHNIWIFGGVSSTGARLNDVWKGRLNKLNP